MHRTQQRPSVSATGLKEFVDDVAYVRDSFRAPHVMDREKAMPLELPSLCNGKNVMVEVRTETILGHRR
jgi:hypothetical protein